MRFRTTRFRLLLDIVIISVALLVAAPGVSLAGKPEPTTDVELEFTGPTGCHVTATLTWDNLRLTGAIAIIYDIDEQHYPAHTSAISHAESGRSGTDTFEWDLEYNTNGGIGHTIQIQVGLYSGKKAIPGITHTYYNVNCWPH